MKELVELLRVCESLHRSQMPGRLQDAARKARKAMESVNTSMDRAGDDPSDIVGGLLLLDAELYNPARTSELLRAAAEEIIYLRQWPGVIAWCDETIDTLRSRVAELERREAVRSGALDGDG